MRKRTPATIQDPHPTDAEMIRPARSLLERVISHRLAPLGALFLVLVAMNSVVFFANRSLIPFGIDSAPGLAGTVAYGYKGPAPYRMAAVDPAGSFDVDYAFDLYTGRTLSHGVIPFWDPYQGLGQPFLAGLLPAVLYPVNLLHIILPPAWGDMVYLANWLIGSIMLYFFLTLIGLGRRLSLFGACVPLASGTLQIYLALREVGAAAAWFPLILYGIERSIKRPSVRASALCIAVGVYCTLSAGQPEVAAFVLAAAGMYAIFRLWGNFHDTGKSALVVIFGFCAGILLSAPIWIPSARYLQTAFSGHPSGSSVGIAHCDLASIGLFLMPYLFGVLQTSSLGNIPGWSWDICPGWLPTSALFLALAAVPVTRDRRRVILYGAVLFILTLCKIYGLPVLNDIGRLPFIDRLIFPRYAAFLLPFSVGILAPFGLRRLSGVDPKRWFPYLITWSLIVLLSYTAAMNLVSDALATAPEDNANSVLLLARLCLGWALLAPWGLWLVHKFNSSDPSRLFWISVLALLLQSSACLPCGFDPFIQAALLGMNLAILVIVFAWASLRPGPASKGTIPLVAILFAVAIPPLAMTLISPYGLPKRYNPVTIPPAIAFLQHLSGQPYRSYSLDPIPMPDFASYLGISSIDNNQALIPAPTTRFTTTCLDRGTSELWFSGYTSGSNNSARYDPVREYIANQRFFRMIGVRYLVSFGPAIGGQLWSNEHPQRRPMLLDEPRQTNFPCPTNQLSEVDVMFFTFQPDTPGTVEFLLIDSAGRTLRTCSAPATDLVSGKYHAFQFSPVTGMKGRRLQVQVRYQSSQKNTVAAVWQAMNDPNDELICKIPDKEYWPTVFFDPKSQVRIQEDPGAAPRVFLAPESAVAPTWEKALDNLRQAADPMEKVWVPIGSPIHHSVGTKPVTMHLQSFHLRPNTVDIECETDGAGTLVLTDSWSPGWQALVNGRQQVVLQVDGAFRGVDIPAAGTYRVRFSYQAPLWKPSLLIALIGLALLFLCSLIRPGRFLRGSLAPEPKQQSIQLRASEQPRP